MREAFEKCAQEMHPYKLDFTRNADGTYKVATVATMYGLWASAYAYAKRESALETDRVLNRG